MKDLEGQVALVTGASRGIGFAVAERLAAAGARVWICSRSTETVERAKRELSSKGLSVEGDAADVSNAGQTRALMDKVLDKEKNIHIVVNNAGITRDQLLMKMSEEDWDTVLDANLKGAFLCTKAVVRGMIKQRYGRIVNISSVIGVTGGAGQANYAASKAGLIGFTKSVAKELGSRGITVNAVAPGFITTDMTSAMSEEQQEAVLKQIPMGRYGEVRDIAECVHFLVSKAAGYITGQVVQVDGGLAM
ncbi:MAG: 3-oxoacyl-[acyl-carrier-protein] reductase [Candidatus Omnitrophica bacterium]|nr:3-oxoacyl-[acyl-carrier-protein] reductase [Candidatus Omnitrophota bacterium]